MVKITAIKTLALDNLGDGCLVKIETDAGLVTPHKPPAPLSRR